MSGAREADSEFRALLWRGTKMLALAVLAVGAVLFAARALGLVGATAVERMVFEQSFQRSEALKARLASDAAALEQIERRLAMPGLEPGARANLEAQAAAIRYRISTTEKMQ